MLCTHLHPLPYVGYRPILDAMKSFSGKMCDSFVDIEVGREGGRGSTDLLLGGLKFQPFPAITHMCSCDIDIHNFQFLP